MAINEPNLFKIRKDLLDIEKKLQFPINERSCKKLFRKLEVLQRTQGKFQFSFDIPEKIRHLFGRVLSIYIESEVFRISQFSERLQTGDLIKASILQEKIRFLKKYHCLSKEHLCQIATAEKIISLTMQSSCIFPEAFQGEFCIESSEKLLEIAEKIYLNEIDTLPPLNLSKHSQSRLNLHLSFLQSTQNKPKILQSLFACAFELSGIELKSYPTLSEINRFFKEKQKNCGHNLHLIK